MKLIAARKVVAFTGATLKVKTAVPPGSTVTEGAEIEKPKSSMSSESALLVAALKFESPPYEAVMLFVPTARVEMVSVATPPDNVPVPIDVVPLRNVTVPVGVPDEGDVTFAVNVTRYCEKAGLRLLVRATCGVVLPTTAVPAT